MRGFETAILFELRKALRNGSIWVPHSLSYRHREQLLIASKQWRKARKRYYAHLNLPQDPEGYVAECTGENLFLVENNKIFTPPKAAILGGITRDSLIILAQDLGYQVIEEQFSRDQLYIADEIFACGTAAEVTPVTRVDHRPIGDGKRGPVTEKIQKLFFESVEGRGKRSAEWLDYVKVPTMV